MFRRFLFGVDIIGGATESESLRGFVPFVRFVFAISVLVLGGAPSAAGGGDTFSSPPSAESKPGEGGTKRGIRGAGILDPTFGTGGRVVVPFDLGGGLVDRGTGIAVMDDGRIVVAGSARTPVGSDFAVFRMESGLIFADGFESGDMNLWSVTVGN